MKTREALGAEVERLKRLIYPPTEISTWRTWALCCHNEETGAAADQAIEKCTQYFNAKIADLEAENKKMVAAIKIVIDEDRDSTGTKDWNISCYILRRSLPLEPNGETK